MNTKARKHHPSNWSHSRKRIFFSQREMRRMRLEEGFMIAQGARADSAHWVLAGEIETGPNYSRVPSHRRCHKPFTN